MNRVWLATWIILAALFLGGIVWVLKADAQSRPHCTYTSAGKTCVCLDINGKPAMCSDET